MYRIYDFRCLVCGHVHEELVDSGVNHQNCPQEGCTGISERIVSAVRFQLPGNDPGFPGAYDKWARDRKTRLKQERKLTDSTGEHKPSVKEI